MRSCWFEVGWLLCKALDDELLVGSCCEKLLSRSRCAELMSRSCCWESCCQGVAVVWVSLDSRSVVGLLGQSCCELQWGADGDSYCWGAVGEEPLVESCCWGAVIGELL